MQHSNKTLAPNMKHLKHILATCMYMQHPNKKLADETFGTYT
jgi:hypothetical protein